MSEHHVHNHTPIKEEYIPYPTARLASIEQKLASLQLSVDRIQLLLEELIGHLFPQEHSDDDVDDASGS